MLYETFWLFFALGVAILISIGLWGIFFVPSTPASRTKVVAMVLSIIIVMGGLYFSYRWNMEKKEIRIFTREAEEAIKQYLVRHRR